MSLGVDYDTAVELRNLLNADWTGWRDIWLERLSDPSWLRDLPGRIPGYLDVANLQKIIAGRERLSNPFDPDNLRLDRFIEACKAGGEFVTENIHTGEVERRWTLPGSPQGAAPSN